MTHTLKAFIIIIASFIASHAHQDIILSINNNGIIEGVPKEFGQVALYVKFYPKDTWNGQLEHVTVKIGNYSTSLPDPIVKRLKTQKFDEITVHASWYHSENIMPYYLSINFNDPGYDNSKQGNRGYSILFNLKTGKIIEMNFNNIATNGYCETIPVDMYKIYKNIDQLLDTPCYKFKRPWWRFW